MNGLLLAGLVACEDHVSKTHASEIVIDADALLLTRHTARKDVAQFIHAAARHKFLVVLTTGNRNTAAVWRTLWKECRVRPEWVASLSYGRPLKYLRPSVVLVVECYDATTPYTKLYPRAALHGACPAGVVFRESSEKGPAHIVVFP